MTSRKAIIILAAVVCAVIGYRLFIHQPSTSTAHPSADTPSSTGAAAPSPAPTPAGPSLPAATPSAPNMADDGADEQGGQWLTPGPSQPSAAPDEAGDASPDTAPYTSTEAARKQWEPIVNGFAASFVHIDGQTQASWVQSLKPYVTKSVIDGLKTVNLGRVPRGHYSGFQLLQTNEADLAVTVSYREGWSMVLRLIIDVDPDVGYRIYQYEKVEK